MLNNNQQVYQEIPARSLWASTVHLKFNGNWKWRQSNSCERDAGERHCLRQYEFPFHISVQSRGGTEYFRLEKALKIVKSNHNNNRHDLRTQNLLWPLMLHTEKCGDFHRQPDTRMFKDISTVIVCKSYSQRKPLWQDFISDACSEQESTEKWKLTDYGDFQALFSFAGILGWFVVFLMPSGSYFICNDIEENYLFWLIT